MFEFLRQLTVGVREAWARLSLNARVQIVLATLLTVAILATVIIIGGQPQYVTFQSRLSPDEADEILVWLTERNIPHQLREGGTTVRVPASELSRVRVGLASVGLPRTQGAIPGFELFNQRDLMTNKWMQDVDYMRAVRGELIRTLNQFEFIRSSVVFINEAKQALFRGDQKPSQASVVLELARPIGQEEIAAVLHTVSMFGGWNLTTQNITIADSSGRVLKRPDEDGSITLASSKLDAVREWASHYESKVYRALENMGHNVVVTASVELDWSSVERHERQVTEGQTVSSQESSTETETTEAPPEGAPGAAANVPEGLFLPGGITTTSTMEDRTENMEPSEIVTRTTTLPGTLKTLNIGVVVDDIRGEPGEDGAAQVQAPTAQELSAIQQLVTSAVAGAAPETEVSVVHHSFRAPPVAVAGIPGTPLAGTFIENRYVILTLQGLLIIAAFFAIRYFMRRAMTLPAAEEEETVEIPEASREDMRRREIAAEVERLSREEPEAVAALLRSWIGEEET